MGIQIAGQNSDALIGPQPINITSSPSQTGHLRVLNDVFEGQRHVEVIEILREKNLPFLEKLMSQIDTIKNLYKQSHDCKRLI